MGYIAKQSEMKEYLSNAERPSGSCDLRLVLNDLEIVCGRLAELHGDTSAGIDLVLAQIASACGATHQLRATAGSSL
ncbi:hypothetical protein [Tardiphaga sp. 768_D3_N2_1]|uniref:hypothetical protein n=1 Tax=Tardiphaga sp. 768_D3_N2_1 TaxID=3240783 RepID=UPI003F899A61